MIAMMTTAYFRTFMLLAALTALFGLIGALFGGQSGMLMALLFATGMNVFMWWNSDQMVLRQYRAQPVDEATAPELYAIVRELAGRADLPMPKVYLINEDQPNAFATGRNPSHAAVAATTGLLRLLSRDEVAGVIAHELAHVKNRDTLTMTLTASLAGAISMLTNFAMFMPRDRGQRANPLLLLLVMMLAPIGAAIVQFAISRSREYEADRIGALIHGNPLALASALARLDSGTRQLTFQAAEANPASAHLFIANPLHGQGMDNLFSTHPSMANRIARLQAMADTSPRKATSIPSAGYKKGPWG